MNQTTARGKKRLLPWLILGLSAVIVCGTLGGLSSRAEKKREERNLIYGKRASVEAENLGLNDYNAASPEYYAALTDIQVKPYAWFLSPGNPSDKFDVRFVYDLGGEYAVSEWSYKAMGGVSTRQTRSLAAKEIAFEISMDGKTWETVDYVRDNVEHDLTRPLQTERKAKYVGFRFLRGSRAVERYVVPDSCLMISELEVTGYEPDSALPEKSAAKSTLEGIVAGEGKYTVYGKVESGSAPLSEVAEYGVKFSYIANGCLYVETVALHSALQENGAYAVTIANLPAGEYEAYTFARIGGIEVYSASAELNV